MSQGVGHAAERSQNKGSDVTTAFDRGFCRFFGMSFLKGKMLLLKID